MISDLLEQYPKYHHLVAAIQLVFAMLGMGMTLRARDFIEIVKEPKPFFTGAVYMLVGIPLIALLLVQFVSMPAAIVVGFFMVAAMPGGARR